MKKRLLIFFFLVSSTIFPRLAVAEKELTEEPGTYPVKTSYVEDGLKLEKTVYVTVKSEDTVIVGDTAIDAKDFLLTVEQAQKMTAKKAISYSGAKAWSTIDGSAKVIASVDLSNVQPVEGVYEVTFSTRENVAKSVKVTVGAALLGNRELNSYKNTFATSYWRFLLTIGLLLGLILVTPLLIVLFSSRNIIQVIDQLIEIFSK